MKLFVTALCISCGMAAALWLIGLEVASLVLGGSDAAKATASLLSSIPVMSFTELLKFLEGREGRKNLAAGKRAPIYDFSGFQIAWPLMALYGCFLLISIDLASTVPAALVDEYIVGNFPDIEKPVRNACRLGLILSTNWFAMILCAYLVGRWIGTRCSSGGMIAVLLVIIISTAFWRAVDLLTPGEEEFTPSEQVLDLLRFPFLICIGLIGYRRGRKYRLSRYMHYLLDVLPAETRDTVIDLAFDEARKISLPKAVPSVKPIAP
jgi:hypothetical protein